MNAKQSKKEIIVIESDEDEQSYKATHAQDQITDIPVVEVTSTSDEHIRPDTTKRHLSEEILAAPTHIDKKPRVSTSLRYIDPSICLTTVQRTSDINNVGCVTLESLIGSPDLELMVQINYMVDIDFIMSKVHSGIRDRLKVIVYHGLRYSKEELMNLESATRSNYPKIKLHNVPVPGMGTHHTKAMLLFFRNNTMQVVIHTANMIEMDWRNKTQGIFTTGHLDKRSDPSPLPNCAFQRDLFEYLQNYKDHGEFTNRVLSYDFTGVRAVLIASIPGKFSGPNKNKWGHLKLRSVLRQQVEIQKDHLTNSKIICQISSIGSLGKDSQDWLRGEFEASLNSYRNSTYMTSNSTNLCVVYPTAENVRKSHEGWSMGGSLPFRQTSYIKQAHYLNPLLHSWKANNSGRERAMPHIKTFTRVTSREDGDYISWFLLTSANLSKPAWGEMKGSEFSIQSFELGVLIFPRLFEDLKESGEDLQVYMMNMTIDNPYPEPQISPREDKEKDPDMVGEDENIEVHHSIGVVTIRLPYDLPLQRYDHSKDNVWLSGKYFPGFDDFGRALEN